MRKQEPKMLTKIKGIFSSHTVNVRSHTIYDRHQGHTNEIEWTRKEGSFARTSYNQTCSLTYLSVTTTSTHIQELWPFDCSIVPLRPNVIAKCDLVGVSSPVLHHHYKCICFSLLFLVLFLLRARVCSSQTGIYERMFRARISSDVGSLKVSMLLRALIVSHRHSVVARVARIKLKE